MKLKQLGYTQKWIDYGVLSPQQFETQWNEFSSGKDPHTEHYRYQTTVDFLKNHERFTDKEVKNFMEFLLTDSDPGFAGAAAVELFTHPKLSAEQMEYVKTELPKFGNWTQKIIHREELKKRIENEPISEELFEGALAFHQKYNSNFLLEIILNKTENKHIIRSLTQAKFSKKLRNLAKQKLHL